MLSEERIMEIAECCPVWYAIPQGREEALLIKFARAIEREVAKGCPRCAELSESINNRAREQAQKTVNNEVYLDKLATLEAELAGLRARYLRMMSEDAATIAQQAEQLAATEKDAERYRWLRSNHPIHDNSPFICRNFGAAFSQWTDDQADKAIDTAIAASREGKS